MKNLLPFLFLFCYFNVFSQGDDVWRPVSKESREYHEYRMRMTIPSYGLAKVKELVAQIEADDNDNEKLNQKIYESLTLREKFTYHMIHAETYNRKSGTFPPIEDEQKKIFGHLPGMPDEYYWSDRQLGFLARNRDSVIEMMKETIIQTRHAGLNFKHAIVEINAIEMIPFLVKIYHQQKRDIDILTVLMILMRENEYEPFIRSLSNKKLYSADSDTRAYLDYNKANEALIIKRATDFYNAFEK